MQMMAGWIAAGGLCVGLMACCCVADESEMRTWSDASGKFSVRATLKEKTNTAVSLITADGRMVEVPITRLSDGDKAYLASLDMPADDPFAGGVPLEGMTDLVPLVGGTPATDAADSPREPVEFPADTLADLQESVSVGPTMALPGTGRVIDLSAAASETVAVGEDPLPEVEALPAGVAALPPTDAYDKLGGPFHLVDDRFVASIGRNKSGSPEETRGRLVVVGLQSGTGEVVWDKPQAVKVLGHHQPTGRTLVVDALDQFQRAGELVMLEGVAEGTPKELYRRSLPGLGKPGFQPMVEWARLLSGSHVAAIVDGSLLVWDLPAAQLLYRVEKVRATEPPAFSGSKRFMAVSQGGVVTVLETATGEVLKTLSTGQSLANGIAFHPSGGQLALCCSNQYVVWDWLDDRIVAEAVTTDQLGSAPICWLSDTQFRTALGSVIDVELGMPVWKYHLGAAADPLLMGDKLVTLATSPKATLVSIAVPHPVALQAMQQLMGAGDEAMLVRPGTKVALAVEGVAGDEATAIEEALTTSAEEAGWKVSRRARITLVAKIGRGEQQQLSYRMMGGRSQETSTATLVPFTADLEIRSGATVLWQRSSTNHVPSLLRLEEGETVQDAVKRYEKPDPGFFGRLNLPPRIPRPEVADQIGMSSLKDGQWMDIPAAIRNRTRQR